MKKFLSILASSGLIQIVGILTGVILARNLGPEGRGIWSKIIFIPSFIANIASFGFDSYFSTSAVKKKYEKQSLINFSVFYAILAGSVCIFIAIFIVKYSGFIDINNVPIEYLIPALSLPFAMLNLLIFSLELGYGRYFQYNLGRLIFAILNVLFLLVLYFLSAFNIYYISIVYVLTNIIAGLLSVYFSHYKLTSFSIPRILELRTLFRGAAPFSIAAISFIIFSQLPNTFAIIFLSPENLGFFTIALSSATIHSIIGTTIGKIMLNLDHDDPNNTNSIRILKFSFITYFVICVVLLLILPSLIIIIYGKQFLQSSHLVLYMIPYTIFIVINDFLDDFFKSKSFVFVGIRSRFIIMILTVLIGLPTLYYKGLFAYVFFLLLVEFFRFLIMLFFLNKILSFRIYDLFYINKQDVSFFLNKIKL